VDLDQRWWGTAAGTRAPTLLWSNCGGGEIEATSDAREMVEAVSREGETQRRAVRPFFGRGGEAVWLDGVTLTAGGRQQRCRLPEEDNSREAGRLGYLGRCRQMSSLMDKLACGAEAQTSFR
jgi:hypothetical protein